MSTQANNLTPQTSNNTKLRNRTLWFDGDSSYPAVGIYASFVVDTNIIFVDELTKDIEQYNKLVDPSKRVSVKTDIRPFDFTWMIPNEYKQLNVRRYIIDKLSEAIDENQWQDGDGQISRRAVRVAKELKLYEQHCLLDVLRVLIYVINTLNSNSVVWGVGRGSSVSSYVLYLIGVHDVDSVEYDLNIEDFLH